MTREELLQKAKPILFNTDMVRTILDGGKTVTRRVVKLKYDNTHHEMHTDKYGTRLIEIQNDVKGETFGKNKDGTTWHKLRGYIEPKRPYRKGDYLYVRETWGVYSEHWQEADYFMYRADYPDKSSTYVYSDGIVCDLPKWRPSIHMPKEAARIFLRVTDVRVERLHDIMKDPPGPNNQIVREGCKYGCDFISEWENTIPKAGRSQYGWDANPWVWVIQFEIAIPGE